VSRTRKDHPVLRRARQRALAEREPAVANRRPASRRAVNVALAELKYATGPLTLFASEVAA
jgi:hypothetical protein